MVSRLDSMASGKPSWDLSDNDMSALKHALQFVPGSDFYKPPAAENQGGPDSASTNKAMDAIALSEQYSTTVIQHNRDGVATMRLFRQWVREQQHHS
jgi:hypothetical protein